MKCKKCDSSNCIKRGKRRGIQRYYCKSCLCSFQDTYLYVAYKNPTNALIIKLLKEGCGILSISRIIVISKNTILSRKLKISNQIKVPYFTKLGCKYEVDEIYIKIANGKSQNWLTYAIEQKTKTVIGFSIGSKSIENIKPIIDNVLLLKPKRIYTDRLPLYRNLVPKRIHKVFQYCTNKIERMNLTLRTHIKRLSRKTICFSRDEKYLEAHLRIYFWG